MLKFFIIWFNEEDTTQSSGIIDWFHNSILLFHCAFRCIKHMLPNIQQFIVGS